MMKKQIYVDTRCTVETKRALICFYLGITSFIQERLGGFKVVRKGTNAGSCFTQVIGTSSGTHSQAMDSSTGTPFAGAGAGTPFAGAGTPFAGAGAGAGTPFAAAGVPFGTSGPTRFDTSNSAAGTNAPAFCFTFLHLLVSD